MGRAIDSSTKYGCIFETLKGEILSGKYQPGQKLPSEMMLMRRFGGSRITVVRALRELDSAGLIVRRKGSGSFMSKRAKSLRRAIGLIMPVSLGEIFPMLSRHVRKFAEQDGYKIIEADLLSADKPDRMRGARRIAGELVAQSVQGVIMHVVDVVPDARRLFDTVLKALGAAGVPVVLTDCDFRPFPERSGYDVVGMCDASAGHELARHVAEAGAKRAVFLIPKFGGVSFENRARGFLAAMKEANLKCAAVTCDPANVRAVKGLFGGERRLDAIVCGNDKMAATVIRTLSGLGKKIPQDVMVAGFDDTDSARVVPGGLTTMRYPTEAIAESAYRVLLARIENPSSRICMISHSATLVPRITTAVCRTDRQT